MKNYTSYNKAVLKSTLDNSIYLISKPLLLSKLKSVAVSAVDEIEGNLWTGNDTFPIYSSNLKDSTGVAVYDYGTLTSFMPPQYAISPQSYGNIKDIWGSQYLKDFMNNSISEFSRGVWIVLFSAVPYAEKVNVDGSPRGRGADYFNLLKEMFSDLVYNKLEKYQKRK